MSKTYFPSEDQTLHRVYWVYWDSETQNELYRCYNPPGIAEENWISSFGGGNYNWYCCMLGFKIEKVIPRDNPAGGIKFLIVEQTDEEDAKDAQAVILYREWLLTADKTDYNSSAPEWPMFNSEGNC